MSAEKKPANRHNISGVFVFLLIGVFSVFSLLLVLIGVGAYQDVVNDARDNAQVRTSISYITNKIHAADAANAVYVEQWHDISTLVVSEWIDGGEFQTRIYYLPDAEGNGGGLYEHFAYVGDDWGPEEGDRIADIQGLDMTDQQGLITLSLTTEDGAVHTMRVRVLAAVS